MALILFDLNGTLLDPGADQDKLQAAVRLAMIHTLAGDFRPLAELIASVGGSVPEEMPPFPDVPAGLERLQRQGHRLAVLTNSARETARQHLDRAGLLDCFESVIAVDEVGVYKPAGRAYEYGLEQLGAPAESTWLVAAHDWDVIGARAAGLRCAFLSRGGPRPLTIEVDAEADRLTDLDL